MKKILIMLAFLVCVGLMFSEVLTSCKKDEIEEPAEVETPDEPDDEEPGNEEPDDEEPGDEEPGDEGDTGDEDEDGDEDGDGDGGDDEGDDPFGSGDDPTNLYIPFKYNPNTIVSVSGTDGDVYYSKDAIDASKPGYGSTLALFSHTTYDEWMEFITTGLYNNRTYNVSFTSEDRFWLYYMGQSKDDPGLDGRLYYIDPSDNSAVVIENSQVNKYCGYSGGYNTGGVHWLIDTAGGTAAADYLWAGIHNYFTDDSRSNHKVGGNDGTETLAFEDVPDYDGNGKKFLFVLTINSRDPEFRPNINFYTYIHVTSEAKVQETLYIPIAPNPNNVVDVEVKDGEFYYSYNAVKESAPDYVGGRMSLMSQSSHDEWLKFVTTGEYGGVNYGLNFASEDAFWTAYKGQNEDDRGLDDAVYYMTSGGQAVQIHSDSSKHGGYNNGGYHAGGFQWNLIPTEETTYPAYFWTGLHNYLLDDSNNGFSVSYNSIPDYDENGKKFLFTLKINSRDVYAYPDIVFYSFTHVADEPEELDPIRIPLKINSDDSSVTGTAGDMYIKWESIAGNSSTALGTIPTYSTMTLDEWEALIKNGVYDGKTYSGISSTGESDFWSKYHGGVSGDYYYLDVYYYDADGNLNAHFTRHSQAYAGSGAWNNYGFQFYLGAEGGTFDSNKTDMHFAAGIHHLLMDDYPYVADYPVVDDYGYKYYVEVIFPSKDPYTNPDIVLYADVHISVKEN